MSRELGIRNLFKTNPNYKFPIPNSQFPIPSTFDIPLGLFLEVQFQLIIQVILDIFFRRMLA